MTATLRASLLAIRANAEAMIAMVDAALEAADAPVEIEPEKRCPHDGTDRVIRQRVMGGTPDVDFCLDCNTELPERSA